MAALYNELEAVIEGIPAEFLCNVDENGCSHWADKQAEVIGLVPADYAKDRVFAPIDRHSKRSTMVGCIAGDGSAMKNMIIVDRVTMKDDLRLFGSDPRKVFMASHSKTFMTTALFSNRLMEFSFRRLKRVESELATKARRFSSSTVVVLIIQPSFSPNTKLETFMFYSWSPMAVTSVSHSICSVSGFRSAISPVFRFMS
jgi:hypothetical protein